MSHICDVDVWLVALEGEGESGLIEGAEFILSPDEKERAARLRFDSDRKRWVRARVALRTVLGNRTGTSASAIRFSYGPHGKPAIAAAEDIEFSLSHAGAWAIIAITRGVPVGIDIERIRENVDIAALLRRLGEQNLPDSRADLFGVWTRREAMTKALGGMLMEPPSGDLRTCDLDAPSGYKASVALLRADPRVATYRFP